jgi:hypothetical protein
MSLPKGDKRKPLTRDQRRTKAAYIYEQTRNIEVIRELLDQKSVSATSAYLNVGKTKALAIARKFDI